jgi:hypothetical protein
MELGEGGRKPGSVPEISKWRLCGECREADENSAAKAGEFVAGGRSNGVVDDREPAGAYSAGISVGVEEGERSGV